MATQTLTYQKCHVTCSSIMSDDERSLNLSNFIESTSQPWAPMPTIPALAARNAKPLAPAEELPRFTITHALSATKSYYLHQRMLEFSPSQENVEAVEKASTDLAYLCANIQYADDFARQVLENWIEIWNFEAVLTNKNSQA